MALSNQITVPFGGGTYNMVVGNFQRLTTSLIVSLCIDILRMSIFMAIPRFAYNLPKYVLGLG
ncbi:hypothetical protein E2986_13791 [Frieseomelitta varia]|uniref:Uncharacterized protein n=1 Tax=Frieseomelitta varia TaxID=561572 RepID=A0A833S181_9HYME|nr:hypothetical protein E2986_13791 [Frieseomelitta varia]